MDEEPEIKGDKLRRAILLVWLANKFEDYMNIADLRRICGYTSSGIYSAIASGWFVENKNGFITLTDKAELYLRKKLLITHNMMRYFIFSLSLVIISIIIQNIYYYELNALLMYNRSYLALALIFISLFNIFWYRIIWYSAKKTH